ncbi:MAG: hypothetical protein M3Y08_17775, partial [Fibrobacterota bacterium]|nr:hypothetical protein [Fibrobacterota bacterium]
MHIKTFPKVESFGMHGAFLVSLMFLVAAIAGCAGVGGRGGEDTGTGSKESSQTASGQEAASV